MCSLWLLKSHPPTPGLGLQHVLAVLRKLRLYRGTQFITERMAHLGFEHWKICLCFQKISSICKGGERQESGVSPNELLKL